MVTPAKQLANGKAIFNLPEIDGRTRASKMIRDISSRIANDLGGQNALSHIQHELIRRLAVLCTLSRAMEDTAAIGEDIDIGKYTTLTNAVRRIAADLGMKRIPKDITTLEQYLEDVAQTSDFDQ